MKQPASPQQDAMHALVTLIQLEKRLRWATPQEAAFIAANETHRLVPYHQAVLLEWDKAFPQLMRARAASGIVEVDQDSEVVRDLIARLQAKEQPIPEGVSELAAIEGSAITDRVIAIPIVAPQAHRVAVLCLLRNQPLTTAEATLMEKLADALAAGLALGKGPGFVAKQSRWLTGHRRYAVLAAVLAIVFFPVRSSVVAPAEVVAESPVMLRSPLQGVIASIDVAPNQAVEKGAPLVTFDEEELRAKVETSRQAVASAAVELRQAYTAGVSNPEARAEIAALDGRLQQQKVNLSFAESQMSRSVMTAPVAGVAVFDNVYDWIGRTVSVGERIMLLADPTRTKLQVQLPVSDNIALEEGGKVLFFSDAVPHRPYGASLSFLAYRAAMDESNVLSYRLEAKWNDDEDALPRLGSVGTAKVYGGWRPLVWHVLRKPMAVLRRIVGW